MAMDGRPPILDGQFVKLQNEPSADGRHKQVSDFDGTCSSTRQCHHKNDDLMEQHQELEYKNIF
jgi:hypothetical protein